MREASAAAAAAAAAPGIAAVDSSPGGNALAGPS